MTTELIPLNNTGNDDFPVNARDLHEFLCSKQDFSTWIKSRIERYDFIESVDFIRFHKKMEANNAIMIEYYVTMNMGKELSMIENNSLGKKARRYFISCESGLKQISLLPDFTDPIAAARAWADSQEKLLESTQAIEAQAAHIKAIEPKAKYTDDVLSSRNSYATTVIAAQLGMSAIKLNRFLSKKQVQRKVSGCWVLCAKYQNKGYEDILTGTIEGSESERSFKQMRWTEKGQKFIIDLWNKYNEFKLEA